jgi:hypothetical protein
MSMRYIAALRPIAKRKDDLGKKAHQLIKRFVLYPT